MVKINSTTRQILGKLEIAIRGFFLALVYDFLYFISDDLRFAIFMVNSTRDKNNLVRLKSGRVRRAELHWYEAHGIGKREIKRKRYLD